MKSDRQSRLLLAVRLARGIVSAAMNGHLAKLTVPLAVLLASSGCVSDRFFVIKDTMSAENVRAGWKVEAFANRKIDFAAHEPIICNMRIEYPRFFERGLDVCAKFELSGPFDMNHSPVIARDSVRKHYVFIDQHWGTPLSIKVSCQIAFENFASLKTLDAYLEECRRRIGASNMSLSGDGVLCLISPLDYTRRLVFGVGMARITIQDRPLSKDEYEWLNRNAEPVAPALDSRSDVDKVCTKGSPPTMPEDYGCSQEDFIRALGDGYEEYKIVYR